MKLLIFGLHIRVIILFFLLIITSNIYSQHNRITIKTDNNSIENIFSQIELQTPYTIAFNHKEIDVKQIITKSIRNMMLKDLFSLILENTSCDFKIKNQHIIIYKIPSQHKRNLEQENGNNQLFYIEGKVFDSNTSKPLEDACISLLDSEKQIKRIILTDDEGLFFIETANQPQQIKITYLGYKTLYRDISDNESNFGNIFLEQDEKELDEVIVKQKDVYYRSNKETYFITNEIRNGVNNSFELLQKLHGLNYDTKNDQVLIEDIPEILFLVNGIQQSSTYIKNILPDRINKVEIIRDPTGYMAIDGYKSVINIILKEDYSGYNINIENFSNINTTGTNDKDWLADNKSSVNFNYSQKKINIYTNVMFRMGRWNTPVLRERVFNLGGEFLPKENKETAKISYNDIYNNDDLSLMAGLNYQFNKNHILSTQVNYARRKIFNEYIYNVGYFDEDLTQVGLKNMIDNKVQDDNYTLALFYKGKINEKMDIYSDLSYNFYKNDINNQFISKIIGSDALGHKEYYFEKKHNTIANIEVNYKLSSSLLNFGYTNYTRRYNSQDKTEYKANKLLFNYKEIRNRFFTYLIISPIDNVELKVGGAIESVNINNKVVDKYSKLYILPHLQINTSPNDKININLSYNTRLYYPSLYELSPIESMIDSTVYQRGNSTLKATYEHLVSLKISFWNRLSIIPSIKLTPNKISENYTMDQGRYYKTFSNINEKEYNLRFIYNQRIMKNLNYQVSFGWYNVRMNHLGTKNRVSGWLLDSKINYHNSQYKTSIQLGYYHGLHKNILWQGYEMSGMDNWTFSLNKQLLDDKLFVELSYILPISLGVKYDQKREIKTQYYTEKNNLDLKAYKNMLFFKVSYRFGNGRIKQRTRQIPVEQEPRQQRSINF